MEKSEKVWLINDIENITESEAKEIAIESMDIKGHTVYFVDFGGYFGYSCLVFADGRHIFYANDYQLHHKDSTPNALHEVYITNLNNKLFTDDELTAPLHDYKEETRKRYYLQNLYPLRRDFISIFSCKSDSEQAKHHGKTNGVRYSNIALGYFNRADDAFVNHLHALYDALTKRIIESEKDPEYMRSAFLYEMYNHEYGINWQADYDVLSCFGNIRYAEYNISDYFNQLHFPPEIQRAYMSARSEYFAHASL